MATGTKSTNLDQLALADELIANRGGSVGRIHMDNVGTQLAYSGAIAERLAGIQAMQSVGIKARSPVHVAPQYGLGFGVPSPEIDGRVMQPGDSILLLMQGDGVTVTDAGNYLTDSPSNGVYIWQSDGNYVRRSDMNEASEFYGSAFQVLGGARSNTIYVCNAAVSNVGSSNIHFGRYFSLTSLAASFATSAQGAKADTAVQPAELAETDNDVFGLGVDLAAETKERRAIIDAQGALPEYRFSDRKGWRLGKLTADLLRTKFFEVGQDRLRAGGLVAEITTRRGLNLRDAKGYFYRPIGMRDIFKTSTRSGAYLRDKKGRTIRIDNQAIPVPDIPEIPEAYLSLASSGAGMFAARAKLAALAQGASGVTSRIVLTGDSWIERDTIADPFSAVLHAKYGRGADGFISLSQTIGEPGSVGLALSGFTVNDVTAQRGAPKAYYGPSGDYIEATGTAATATVSGIKAETLNIYYWDGDGTFRYRIDGGAWVEVVGGSTGAPAKVSITGLATGSNHTVNIDTATNAGTVRLTNLYATGMDGVEVSKIGNAEARSTDFTLFIDNPMSAFVLADIAPQAVCVCLGTNDVSANVGLTAFKNGLAGIAAAYRAAYAHCGAILAAAPQSSRSGAQTNAGYHATSIDTAKATDLVEYIDMVSLFGPYAARTTPGVWQDDSHLNTSGGRLWASHIINTFFNIT